MTRIYRLGMLDKVFDIYTKMQNQTKRSILNLSDWQVSENYKNFILKSLQVERSFDFIDYQYIYTINDNLLKCVKEKLNVLSNQDLILTNNNTTSILMISNLLKQIQASSIGVIGPAYFSIYEALNLLEIPYTELSMRSENKDGMLPKYSELLNYEYLWITSPIFSSSVYFKDSDIKKLKSLQKKGIIIIADEAYSYISLSFSKKNFYPNMTILSPNKVLNINSLKFSAIIYDKKYNDIFIDWSDVLCGNMNISSIEALYHFLTPNYELCVKENKEFLKNALGHVNKILENYEYFYVSNYSQGNMIMIYNQKINADIVFLKNFYEELIVNTSALILPGFFHDYNKQDYLCFRVNLCLYNDEFMLKLDTVLQYLSKKYE